MVGEKSIPIPIPINKSKKKRGRDKVGALSDNGANVV